MSSKSLTVSPGVEMVREVLAKVTEKAAKTLEGLYDGTNPDAEKTWAECSMKTRASLIIVKDAQQRAEATPQALLGVVFVPARATSKEEWEAMARRVDEDERKRNAIDVAVDDE